MWKNVGKSCYWMSSWNFCRLYWQLASDLKRLAITVFCKMVVRTVLQLNKNSFVLFTLEGTPQCKFLSIESGENANAEGIKKCINKAFERIGITNFSKKLLGLNVDGMVLASTVVFIMGLGYLSNAMLNCCKLSIDSIIALN